MNIIETINDPLVIKKLLLETRNIAVVGISLDPLRPSHDVSRYMQKHGYRIIPVTPVETEILGEKTYQSLFNITESVDLVNIFRRSELAGQHVDEAIKIGAKAVWMQDGVIDEAAATQAIEAGLLVVMDRCLLREHVRLGINGRK